MSDEVDCGLCGGALSMSCQRCDRDDPADDPTAFWSSLSPAQALALLRAAPRVAGPREKDINGTFRRGSWVVTNASQNNYFIGFAYRHAGAATLAEKEANADERLRAAGWLLVDDAPRGPSEGE